MSNSILITKKAQAHFSFLLEKQPKHTNIRVFVSNPGTQNAECGVSYCSQESIKSTDTEFKFDGFSAYIDKLSLPFLKEAKIDLITEKMGTQLTLKAPNAKMRTIASDASLLERVEYIIQTRINPRLAEHNGYLNLLEITNDGVAMVIFGGGCNGCSMVDMTLREGIEKELLQQFEGELTKVCDATEHSRNTYSYY
ncbi:Fe/S biogenesis protein nfuA [Candidatus Photodesmus blepharus]|uniref:Fe/S biogenesis protein NfuA n=1 Tax=Candidatus Photodesmus blepharonis TaxID=1179155 RepID=A0A084CNK8_9GAMM|nr:Fe-S biogenesis protein NfuA [Candidatus Photodesmus blepharus]KEY91387.1 Fe/S biogenesis protein nfuA [Candidatus Photodesmus blepharus]